MTQSQANAQTEALAVAIPGLEKALRAAAERAMTPGVAPLVALGFLQLVVGWARTIRQYRKAAGLPSGWSDDLALLLGSIQLFAQARVYDPALTAPWALRFSRVACALAQAVLLACPVQEKPKKPAPNPVVRPKAPPVLPRLPDMPNAVNPALDLSAVRDPAIVEALRKATAWNNTATGSVRSMAA